MAEQTPDCMTHCDLVIVVEVAGAVVGRGFKFGYKQEGTADLLKSLGTEAGLKIDVLDLVGASTPGVVGNVRFK